MASSGDHVGVSSVLGPRRAAGQAASPRRARLCLVRRGVGARPGKPRLGNLMPSHFSQASFPQHALPDCPSSAFLASSLRFLS